LLPGGYAEPLFVGLDYGLTLNELKNFAIGASSA
jgi:hypothetical protein